MKIEKKRLGDLERCYTASHFEDKDGVKVILASESYVGEGRPCHMYGGPNFDDKELIWEDNGGCVSMIQIPGKENEVLAIQDFYLKESPSSSKLVWGVRKEKGKWEFKDVIHIQYLHRFAIVDVDGKLYVILATIADSKKNKEDWEHPGSIYVAELPEDPSKGLELTKIKTNIWRNHGFQYDNRPGHNELYFGTEQGIFVLHMKGEPKNWKFEHILEKSVGEIALGDLDGDGVDEIITIEPMHGDHIRIYKNVNGKYEQVYEHEKEIEFAHALITTTFRGVPTFVCGVRRIDAELFYIQYKDGKYVPTIIETEVGPANLDCVNFEDRDVLISANHSKNEAAIYIITE